jgi:hypothetical protein
MKNNFTQGVWKINPRASLNVQGENGISIASCSAGQGGDNLEQEQANALLICKAPPLFTLVSKMLEHLENKAQNSKTDFVEDEFIRQAKEILNK